ncbi:hypothetical protein KAV79_04690 [Candidatus Aerophobetes bacterium]|nr:hypothetical protein [Candidatus Aerophobetes bacterium]
MAKEDIKKEKKPGTDLGIGNTSKGIFDGIAGLVDSVTALALGKKEKPKEKEKEITEKEEKKKNSQQKKD